MMKKILLSSAVFALLMGCSSTQTLSKTEKNLAYGEFLGEQNISSLSKITSFKFTGWKSLTDDYVIMTAMRNKDYLVQFKSACVGLRFTNAIKLNQSNRSTFDKHGDSISAVGDSALSSNCYIESIHPLTEEQSKQIVAIGEKAPSYG